MNETEIKTMLGKAHMDGWLSAKEQITELERKNNDLAKAYVKALDENQALKEKLGRYEGKEILKARLVVCKRDCQKFYNCSGASDMGHVICPVWIPKLPPAPKPEKPNVLPRIQQSLVSLADEACRNAITPTDADFPTRIHDKLISVIFTLAAELDRRLAKMERKV